MTQLIDTTNRKYDVYRLDKIFEKSDLNDLNKYINLIPDNKKDIIKINYFAEQSNLDFTPMIFLGNLKKDEITNKLSDYNGYLFYVGTKIDIMNEDYEIRSEFVLFENQTVVFPILEINKKTMTITIMKTFDKNEIIDIATGNPPIKKSFVGSIGSSISKLGSYL